jgi:predicted DNA-binding transcriptional regulator YafY
MRAVEPHRLVHTGYRWYLVAWDTSRKDWRTFRIDRIEGKPKTSIRFTPRKPPEGDFAKFVSKSLSQAPYPIRARITLRAPLDSLAKRIPPSAGVLETVDQNSCLLRTGSYSVEGIAMHLAWLGVDFQVHEPQELIDHLRTVAARFTASIA